jgi:hypothetical protein
MPDFSTPRAFAGRRPQPTRAVASRRQDAAGVRHGVPQERAELYIWSIRRGRCRGGPGPTGQTIGASHGSGHPCPRLAGLCMKVPGYATISLDLWLPDAAYPIQVNMSVAEAAALCAERRTVPRALGRLPRLRCWARLRRSSGPPPADQPR